MNDNLINRLERSNLCLMDQNEAQRETIKAFQDLTNELQKNIDLKGAYIDSIELELVSWKEIQEISKNTIEILEKDNMEMSLELVRGEK